MTVHFGSTSIGVVSESSAVRGAIVRRLGEIVDDRYAREGILLGRPSSRASGRPLWVLYESGDIVLRRTPDENAAIDAALFHLQALSDATRSTHPTLRLRTILTPDGEALLVDPPAIHELPGYDRRLTARGYIVLPTTIATVNLRDRTVLLPGNSVGRGDQSSSARIRKIVLRQRDDSATPQVVALLGVVRSVLRRSGDDLEQLLDDALEIGSWSDILRVSHSEQIRQEIAALGRQES